ncbi:MAG: hypothetical protein JWM21_2225 [Acidobacteria bacterium]|nr:hypothetical protein [Acidobacteriota bacterium]
MTLEFHRTEPANLDALARLLISVFNASPDAIFANSQVLRWKYFESGPQWEGSRSYLLTNKGEIQAHCAVWPLNLHFSGQRVTCNCFIDWANGRNLPGAGFMLKRQLLSLSDAAIVVGGSPDTRAIVPRLGFAHAGEVALFARVVRPWRQFRTRPTEPIWKGTARLLRNTVLSQSSPGAISKGWRAERINSFESVVHYEHESDYPIPWRDSNYLNYWLRCPAAEVLGYALLNNDCEMGYFLLSHVEGQTRIADIRLHSQDAAQWTAAYRLAARVAAELPETCEVLAVASTPFADEALTASGFRNRGSVPFFLYDPKKKLAGAPPIFWNMIEGDAAYLQDPAYPYAT